MIPLCAQTPYMTECSYTSREDVERSNEAILTRRFRRCQDLMLACLPLPSVTNDADEGININLSVKPNTTYTVHYTDGDEKGKETSLSAVNDRRVKVHICEFSVVAV